MNEVPVRLVEVVVYVLALVDAVFVSALTVMTGGFGSILYWLFVGPFRGQPIRLSAVFQQMVRIFLLLHIKLLHPLLSLVGQNDFAFLSRFIAIASSRALSLQ
jgi:uncharacterized membrane protein